MLGERPGAGFEVVAPQRSFDDYSAKLIERAIQMNQGGQGGRSGRSGRGLTMVNNFNTPLQDRRMAERLTNEVLRPQVRRETARRRRTSNEDQVLE